MPSVQSLITSSEITEHQHPHINHKHNMEGHINRYFQRKQIKIKEKGEERRSIKVED